MLILAAGALAVYWQTFSVPLLFDDASSIAGNSSIHRLWPLGPVLSPPNDAGVGGRPLYNLSYALNYAFGGTAVFGYHLVNLLIHVSAGWILFALVRGTLRRPVLAARFGPAATALALAISAIWTWHPLQTESVTYLSQRAESLMGLFYLLTLYCFMRGAGTDDQKNRRIWFTFSVLACLAGVATKEVIVTAPLMVFLYDRTFISGSFAGAWRRHGRLYWVLAATWLPLGYLMLGLHQRGVGFGQGVAWWAYGLVECRVVVKYLLLALWPHPLVFDYGEFVAPRLSEIWPSLLVLASLLTAAVVSLRRWPAVGFAACWFFVLLAPTSSIVPIAGQPMAESRVYLALAGIAALVVLGVFSRAGRWSMPFFAVVALGLGLASARRNRDYASTAALWSDTVAKCPANARAHNNLGEVWLPIPERSNDAIAHFQEALRLKPDFAEAHTNLGSAFAKLPGRLDEAIAQYQEALRLKPDSSEAHFNLGTLLAKLPGRLDEAIAHYQEALRLKPDSPINHFDLGNALARTPGRLDDAIAQYQEALRLKPDFAEAHFNLGNIWLDLPGRLDDAIAQFQEALRLKPDYPEAHFNLGNAWLATPGRLDDAIAQFQEALRLKPDFAEARFNLANALVAIPGRINEAIAEYQETLRLKPDYPEVHFNLGNVWAKAPGRLTDAIAQYQEALRQKPDYAEAHFNLAVALLNLRGRNGEAAAHLEAFLRLRPENEAARQLLAKLRTSQR